MCYYKENLGDKFVTVKHAIIGISEEIKHDADLAIAFENRALVSKKGKGLLQVSVLESRQLFMVWNYFETSHGNNVCDGLGATVKNTCYRPVISNRKVIGNADDVHTFCQDNL